LLPDRSYSFNLSFYPKQDECEGYGSLIRLPLGVHRRSGQRYHFIERGATGLVSLTSTEEDRAAWFTSITLMGVPLRQWNEAQDPFQVIGRYVSLTSKGVGQCPFGEHHTGGRDTKASLKVYTSRVAGGYCWYCYTWQRGRGEDENTV